MFDFVFDFGAFWVPFWSHFGTPSRPFWESIFALFLDVAPRAPQERPKRRQEAQKGAPRGPQEPPKGAKRPQKAPQEAPQEAPKGKREQIIRT